MEIDIERLGRILDGLRDKAVVVEGKKDERALSALGVNGVVPINGRPLIKLIPLLKDKEVVILTDFDSEGRRIAAELRKLLQAHRIMLNTRLRKELMSLGVHTIEGMRSLAPEMEAGIKIKEGDRYGKTSADVDKVCR